MPVPNWRALALPSALVFASFIYAMHETFSSLLDLWSDSGNYGHGFLVLGVSVYLLYLSRQEIAAVRPQVSYLGLLIACGLIGVWFASRVLSVLIGEQVSFVLALLSTIMALYGVRAAKIVSLPILYLYCAVPVWSYLIPVLQDSTAYAATVMSRAFGVPIYLEGLYMTIPDGVFLVAEVCSGLSYLLAALSLGGFFALLNLRIAWTRIAIVALAIGAGVVFNWIRVTAIVMFGYYDSMKSAIVQDHIMFGWLLFLLVIIFVMFCGRILERVEVQHTSRPRTAIATTAGAATSMTSIWGMALACILVLSVPAYASMRMDAAPQQVAVISLAEQLGRDSGWQFDASARSEQWSTSFLGADSQTRAAFRNGQRTIDVQVGYFAAQRQGAEAVNERHAVFDPKAWRRVSQKAVPKQASIAPGFEVNEVAVQPLSGAKTRLVWWWYWVDGEFTASRVQAKVLQIRSILSGNRPAAIVVMSSAVVGTAELTRDEMKTWLRDSAADLAANLSKPSS